MMETQRLERERHVLQDEDRQRREDEERRRREDREEERERRDRDERRASKERQDRIDQYQMTMNSVQIKVFSDLLGKSSKSGSCFDIAGEY